MGRPVGWHAELRGFPTPLSLPNIPSALFYKHLRLLSAMLFAATIEAFQPERTASLWECKAQPSNPRHAVTPGFTGAPGTPLPKINASKARHLLRFDADVIFGMHRFLFYGRVLGGCGRFSWHRPGATPSSGGFSRLLAAKRRLGRGF